LSGSEYAPPSGCRPAWAELDGADVNGDEVSDLCMMCGESAFDADDASQWDSDGIYWVYCKACDCWTEHPVPDHMRFNRDNVPAQRTPGKTTKED